MSRHCQEGLLSEHLWKVRQKIFYLPIREEEPLPVEMFSGEDGENTLDDWLPLWCEQSGTDGPNLNYSASSTPERTCRLETEKSEYEKGV